MSKLIILSAPSGVGKSTLARNIQLNIHADKTTNRVCDIISTDNFWVRPNGSYSFNARELEEAHQWAFDKFKNLVTDVDYNKYDIVVVLDNTNLRFSEFERYCALALKYGWDIEIERLYCNFTAEELFERNVHSVPLETIKRQLSRWENAEQLQSGLDKLLEKINNG